MTISGVKIKKTDGTWAGGTSPAPDVQDFITSGTWTKPTGARLIVVELVGGGGGGYNTASMSGGGGQYASMAIPANLLGATESVTVGAGGVATGGVSYAGGSSFAGLTAMGGYNGGVSGANYVGQGGGLYAYIPQSWRALGPNAVFDGGWGGGNSFGGSSDLGAGGAPSDATHGLGGTLAATFGALKAGNGGNATTPAQAPGGGAMWKSSAPYNNGARGQVRITTYF